jgi:myo-inositol 2-dehydrogenase / D-chiro-inositol 1-dehydrogenase
MGDKIKVGILGAGMMGLEHILNLRLLPDVEIAAVADPAASSLEWARGALGDRAAGVAVFSSADEMARRASLDAVIVATPNHTHRAVLEPIFETGWHVLCEKPLCTTLADARWVVERAAGRRAVFWVGMEYRFMPPAARFVAEVHSGRLGTVRMLAMREHRFPFLTKVGDWNRFSRNTGGTMVEKCCHFFDLMRLILRSEPVRVFCSGAMDVNHLDERYDGARPDILDNSYTVVDFASGARAMLDLCMFAEGSANQEEIVAVGERAKLEVLIPEGALVLSPRVALGAPKQVERSHVGVDEAVLRAGAHHGATHHQQRAFLAAVRGAGPVIVTAEDGLRAVAMGIAAETSAREGRVVAMAEVGR